MSEGEKGTGRNRVEGEKEAIREESRGLESRC